MIKTLSAAFIDHPKSVDETYWEHFRFAGRTGFILLGAAAAAMVHAVFPFLCERTASTTIRKLHSSMTNRFDEA